MIKKILSISLLLISIALSHQVQPELINNPAKLSINGTYHRLISYSMGEVVYELVSGDSADTIKTEQAYGNSTLISKMILRYENDNLIEVIGGYLLDTAWTLTSNIEYNYNSFNQVLDITYNSYDNTGSVYSASRKEYEYKNSLPYIFTNYSTYSDTTGPSSITKYEYPSLLEYVEYEAGDMANPDSFSYKRHYIYQTTDLTDSIISYSLNEGQWEESGINYYPTDFSGDKVSKLFSNSVSIDGGDVAHHENAVTSYTYSGDTVFVELKSFPYFGGGDTTIINYIWLNTKESSIDITKSNVTGKNANFKTSMNGNTINITFNKAITGNTLLTLTDLKGRICKKSVVAKSSGVNMSMDLTGVAKGYYLLSVENKDGSGVIKFSYK